MEKLCECGCGNAVNLKWSSKTRFLRGHSSKGRVFDDALREKMRQNGAKRKNRSHSEETKKKISESQQGRIISDEELNRLKTLNLGRVHTEESRKNMSNSRLGKKRGPYNYKL